MPHRQPFSLCAPVYWSFSIDVGLGRSGMLVPGGSVRYYLQVARWHPFDPAEFNYEFNDMKLAAHEVDRYEAGEVFWNGFEVRRNKRIGDRYQIIGRTDSGRILKLIVQRMGSRIRVITGWPL